MSRYCTARRCLAEIPAGWSFCSRHWGALGADVRRRIEWFRRRGAGALLSAQLRYARHCLALREG